MPSTIGRVRLGVCGADLQDRFGEQPVATRQMLARALADLAACPASALDLDRMAERDLVGTAGRLAELALDEAVHDHLRHAPPGRELPARDRDHAGGGLVQLRPA